MTAKEYEMPFSLRNLLKNLFGFFYFFGLTFTLVLISPNQLTHDPSDGGRANLYILCFGTAIVVLQMQIGHLARKEFNVFGSIPYLVSNAVLTIYIALIVWPCEQIDVKAWESPLMWTLAIYLMLSKPIFNF